MQLPTEIKNILKSLNENGFEAYVVGGAVRDLLRKVKPKDWDVTTNALPEEIQNIFPRNFYTNQFGTVTVLTHSPEQDLKEIEVTTYRVDGKYGDQRHPDQISFSGSLKEDLARRDFTINALALMPSPATELEENEVDLENLRVVDPFGGIGDLNNQLIRAVGLPGERFSEDALRLLRAVRFAAQLGFNIEPETEKAMTQYATSLKVVSNERVRDELVKIVMSDQPELGFNILQRTGLLAVAFPEIAEGVGVGQNKHHIYTVFEHNIKSLQFAAQYDYSLPVRLAALLHDIGKPRTKRKQGNDYTFYAHDIVGARMAEKMLKRLKFPGELIKKVVHLVRQHMFYYDVGKVTEAGARRLLRRVGKDHFADLIKVRIAERKGSGVPKAEPYRLRHLQFMIEKAAQEPISVGQLAIGGNDLIKELSLKPSPIIGGILNALLAEVLDDPKKNTREHLLQRAAEIKDKDPAELKKMGETAKEEQEKKREDDIKRKYRV